MSVVIRLPVQFYETWRAWLNSTDLSEKLHMIGSQNKHKQTKPVPSKQENLQHIG